MTKPWWFWVLVVSGLVIAAFVVLYALEITRQLVHNALLRNSVRAPDFVTDLAAHHDPTHPFSVFNHAPGTDSDAFVLSMGQLSLRDGQTVVSDAALQTLPLQTGLDPYTWTPVYNQHSCNSCWAVAATGAVSDRLKLKTDSQERWSVQAVLNCLQKKCKDTGTPMQAWGEADRFGWVKESVVGYIGADTPDNPGACDEAAWSSHPAGRSKAVVLQQVRLSDPVGAVPPSQLSGSLPAAAAADSTVYAQRRQTCRRLWVELATLGPAVCMIAVWRDLYYYQPVSSSDGTGPIMYVPQSPGSSSNPFVGMHSVEVLGYVHPQLHTDADDLRGAYWVLRNSWGNWPSRPYQGHYGLFFLPISFSEDPIGMLTNVTAADAAVVTE